MAQLLAKSKAVATFRKRDAVSGTITKLTPSEILVDINAKSEALILEKDRKILKNVLSTLHVGDTVTVTILSQESEMGYPVVSIRRYIDDLLWQKLELLKSRQEPIPVVVREATRGGFLAEAEDVGFSGFLPHSQVAGGGGIVGARLNVYILELNREQRKIILSQKRVMREEEFERAIKDLTIGQKIDTVVANSTSFGLFVTIPRGDESLDGFVHISEVSWEPVNDLISMFPIGTAVQCEITGIEKEARRIELSIKRLIHDPFLEMAKQFAPDQEVKGTVTRLSPYGVWVAIEAKTSEGNPVEALIRKEKIPPNLSLGVGSEVTAVVSEIDEKRRRILLVPVLREKPIGYR